MSSKFTHNICNSCWVKRHPNRRPLQIDGPPDLCCFCGEANADGIYVRHDPDELFCKREHQENKQH